MNKTFEMTLPHEGRAQKDGSTETNQTKKMGRPEGNATVNVGLEMAMSQKERKIRCFCGGSLKETIVDSRAY